MKKFLLVLFFFVIFSLPATTYAHTGGQPPFFKMNGTYAGYYPLQLAGISNVSFDIPQDVAPEPYMVNVPIDLEIDSSQVNIPNEILSHAKFTWYYGDATPKDGGLKNTHVYKKIGSYVLTIYVNYDQAGSPNTEQLLETVFLNIIPNASYKLPRAVILVDGKKPHDALRDVLKIDLNNALSFDASQSVPGSSKIVSYLWDFGDDKTSTEKNTSHQFQLPQFFVSPVLRIKDANGFISDAFVNIQNSGKNDPNNPSSGSLLKNTPILIVAVVLLFIICAGILLLIFFGKKKSTS